MNIIKMTAVNKYFGTVSALSDINLEVNEGEVVTIIGPSGSGKSTLLRSINQLEKIDSGTIEIEGEAVVSISSQGKPEHINKKQILRLNKKLGMVFQHFNLFPHKTVLENIIEAPLTVNKEKKEEALKKAHALLETVGLIDKKDSVIPPGSQGDRSRELQ